MEPRRVLVTAGTVYGRLDSNKLVGNRVRGIWATRFAAFLVNNGFDVTLLLPDTYPDPHLREVYGFGKLLPPNLTVVQHTGFWNYRDLVIEYAPGMDGMVLAAAVVNWIPEIPYEGKMPTKGVGDRISVPFILAPRVIDQVRKINPNVTLIGCKMTIGATADELKAAANELIASSRCAAVVMNDMKTGLHLKSVLHPDQAVIDFDLHNDSGQFSAYLMELLRDRHFRTKEEIRSVWIPSDASKLFDFLVEKYRSRFVPAGQDRVFGSVAVRLRFGGDVLMSPREKGEHFTSKDAVVVSNVEGQTVYTCGGKATLNAPLLYKFLLQHKAAHAVLHLHEQLPEESVQPYAPPGTVRDSIRSGQHSIFNIQGHGFIAALDENGEMLRC